MKKTDFINSLEKVAEIIDGLLKENSELREKLASFEVEKKAETLEQEAMFQDFFGEKDLDWAKEIGEPGGATADPEQRLVNAIMTGSWE